MSDNLSFTGYRGLGHPNKILQADFAGSPETTPKWFLRLETLVPIDDAKLDDVKRWLSSKDQRDIDELVNYLLAHVPPPPAGMDVKQGVDAKHMVAAAFGREPVSSSAPSKAKA